MDSKKKLKTCSTDLEIVLKAIGPSIRSENGNIGIFNVSIESHMANTKVMGESRDIMGPEVSNYNKRLIILPMIQLSSGHCSKV